MHPRRYELYGDTCATERIAQTLDTDKRAATLLYVERRRSNKAELQSKV
jgi:hypothetical protein